ncbi:hypothetical protein CBG58_02840 [Fusobacterium polymorphum]|nr:hypothetical protein CBG58_02840 [Fusobacterium polymorphum]
MPTPQNPFLTSSCLLYDFVASGFISTFFPFKLIFPLETTFAPSSKRLFFIILYFYQPFLFS